MHLSPVLIAMLPLVVTSFRGDNRVLRYAPRTLRGTTNATLSPGERNGNSSSSYTRALDAGPCGDGNVGNGACPDGSCCSVYGWCGTGSDYCTGSNVGPCGNGNVGNGACPDGSCCSVYGWCGTGSDYCSGSNPPPAPSPVAAPSPTEPVSGSSNSDQWLTAHNSRRAALYAQYSLSPKDLKWSDSLAASALGYSQSLLSLAGCMIQHGYQDNHYGGENLAANWGGSSGNTPDQVLQLWFDGEGNLPFGQNGHFTQVAWRASSYVGCGVASKTLDDGTGCFIQTCRYLAPGNCNIDATNFLNQALQDSSPCGPACPSEGCF